MCCEILELYLIMNWNIALLNYINVYVMSLVTTQL